MTQNTNTHLPTTNDMTTEDAEAVAARHMDLLPDDVRKRMDALHQRAQDLLRTFGPELLAIRRETNAVEEAIDGVFGTLPHDWEARYAGTTLEAAMGVLALISKMAEHSYDPDLFIEHMHDDGPDRHPPSGSRDVTMTPEAEVTTADLSPDLRRRMEELEALTAASARQILTEARLLAGQVVAAEEALTDEHGLAVDWSARFGTLSTSRTRRVMHAVASVISLDGGPAAIEWLLDDPLMTQPPEHHAAVDAT